MKTVTLLGVLLGSAGLICAESAQERLNESAAVLNEVMATPDKGIPQDLLAKAHCAVIVPNMKKGAFIVGAKYGRGYAVCRSANGWGAPSAIRVEGGSFGLQIGVSDTDIVMLVMNERGMKHLLDDKFTLGADATIAAGPVGRDTSALTDAQMSAEMLSWSRSKGLFAGISLTGSTLRNDGDQNQELYGESLHNKDILMTGRKTPEGARPLVSALNKYSRFEDKNVPVETQAVDAVKGDADRSKTKKK